jgi:hypothetical protein
VFRQSLAQFVVASTLAVAPLFVTSSDSPTAGTQCGSITRFEDATFPTPTRVDNRWSPLVPGTQYVLEGRSNRGGGALPHNVVLTVTEVTKVVNGVRSVAVWDRDISEGILGEAELALFAQDAAGNVWGVGEYPEEYDNGLLGGAPNTWFAGVDHANAGIAMPADPRLGMSGYLQGWAPDIDFLDCARPVKTGQRLCVPANCYSNVLLVDEWSPLDPLSGHQLKYVAPGVGNTRIGAVNDPEGETLVLARIVQLDANALAEANREALKLDERGLRTNDVYRQTTPAECATPRCPGAASQP